MAKLVCTLELSKDKGLTIKVTDDQGTVTQTVTMDGTTLCLKVVGQNETSTWTQTDAAIKIACKDFEVVASNSIKCTAKQTITFESEEGDTNVSSGGSLMQIAKQDLAASGNKVTVEAKTTAAVKGQSVEATGSNELKLSGQTKVDVKGATVQISADSQLDVKSSGMATIGGSATTIKGSMIKAG